MHDTRGAAASSRLEQPPRHPAGAAEPATNLGDIDPTKFRAAMHRVADLVADYLEGVSRYPVVPPIQPGDVRKLLPGAPPADAEPLDRILDDYQRLIEPNTTHWNHPGFMAYFSTCGSRPGVLGEALAAALNVNAMLWRTGPAPTELEEHVCDWLRQMLGLPAEFRGHINDTASIGSLLALAAAREKAGLQVRSRGMAGRADLPPLTVYCSEHAHSSIDKACITLGLGHENLRKVATDAEFRMDSAALEAAIARDHAAGARPIAIVATLGTTSTTSVDPLRPIARIAAREQLWLHVDGAYAGSAGICPEYRGLMDGIDACDSFVLNPHKWLYVPVDCSVLFVRDTTTLKRAFSVIPDYLQTSETGVTNLMDYGVQLGRRFRALKFWMVLRAFGVSGLQARIRQQCQMARAVAGWIEVEPGFVLAAPVPFSTICFRAVPAGSPEAQDRFNEELLARVNAAGPVFISHTRLGGRFILRLTVGNLRTERRELETLWHLVRTHHARLLAERA